MCCGCLKCGDRDHSTGNCDKEETMTDTKKQEGSDSLHELVWNQAQLTAQEQLEWLWENCRIVYQDIVENYPIEHCQWAKKDSRAFIEAQMPNNQDQRQERR